jgi:hypothetical protein
LAGHMIKGESAVGAPHIGEGLEACLGEINVGYRQGALSRELKWSRQGRDKRPHSSGDSRRLPLLRSRAPEEAQ